MLRALLLCFCVLLAAGAGAAAAQDIAAQEDAVSLFADDLSYETRTRQIVARGNVEVFYGPARLTAREIRYDGRAGTISAVGPIRLTTGGTTVILASLAELSTDFREGLIRGARLILDRQFQIASAEGRRTQGRFNTLYKTVASSCTICADAPVPIWRIRAATIVHDEVKERLYFENAWFDIFGLPILWVPRLRIPEPGVERASGVLVPTFSNSDIYGFGVKVPYYQTLGDHADVTLTPFVTTEGAVLLEAEYRRRLKAGAFRLAGVYAIEDEITGDRDRGALEVDGVFALPRGFRADVAIRLASDKDFLRQFSYSDNDRLNSVISINRYRANDYLDFRLEGDQTLRDAEVQGEIPFVLPRVEWRKIWYDGAIPGQLGVKAQALNLVRSDGRDVVRAAASADWRLNATTRSGVLLAALADLGAEVYSVSDDPAFDDGLLARATPAIGVELRWPLARSTASATHVIEPVAQVLYSDTFGDEDVPNEDGLLPELDETNLFALNRFPGLDRRETGARLNYGLNYTRYDPTGWNLGLTIGQVLKLDDDPAVIDAIGLSGRRSDFVTALSVELPPRLTVIGRSQFDNDFDFQRAELEFAYARPNFDLSGSYTYLSADRTSPASLGTVGERQELSLEGRYRFHPNWEFDAEWRYDLANSRSIEGDLGLTYGNECIQAALSLSRRYTTSNNVPPNTEISFQVRLAGLGGNARDDWPARRCSG